MSEEEKKPEEEEVQAGSEEEQVKTFVDPAVVEKTKNTIEEMFEPHQKNALMMLIKSEAFALTEEGLLHD